MVEVLKTMGTIILLMIIVYCIVVCITAWITDTVLSRIKHHNNKT